MADMEQEEKKPKVDLPSKHTVGEWIQGFRNNGVKRNVLMGAAFHAGLNLDSVVSREEMEKALKTYQNIVAV